MAPHVRTLPTASKATAVQIVWSSQRGDRDVEHIGSGHTGAEVAMLKSVAYRRIAGEDQQELDLGLAEESASQETSASAVPLGSGVKVAGMRMGPLIDALTSIYKALGFDEATDGDQVFYQQVLARLVEPTSKYDTLRVIEEIGLDPVSYATVKRRLPPDLARTISRAVSGSMLGTATEVTSSRRSNQARCTASLASVFTRSPEGGCSFDGATTSHRSPTSVSAR